MICLYFMLSQKYRRPVTRPFAINSQKCQKKKIIFIWCESRQFEEEGEQLVFCNGVVDVQLHQGRNQINQVFGSHEDTRLALALEVVYVLLLENLPHVRLGRSELACQVVATTLQSLSEIRPVPDIEYPVIELEIFLMNPHKVHLYLFFLVEGQEPAPVGLLVFFLIYSCMFVDDAHDIIQIELLFFLGVGQRGKRVFIVHGWSFLRRLLGGDCLLDVVLSLALVPYLIIDVGVHPCYFFVIDQQGDLALPVPQFISELFHLLPGTDGLIQGLVLNQHVSPLSGQLVPLDLHIAYKPKFIKDVIEVLFVGILRVVPHTGVDHRNQMLEQFVVGIVADHIESFEMVGKEDLKICVVTVVVQSHVYVVVICAGVGGVLHLQVLHEDEVFYYLDGLDLTVFAEKTTDESFVCVLHAAYVELTHQNALVDLLGRLGLLGKFLSLQFGQLHVGLVDLEVIIYSVVADRQSYLLLTLLLLPLLVVSFVRRTRTRSAVLIPIVSAVSPLSASGVLVVSFVVVMTVTTAAPFRIRRWGVGVPAIRSLFVVSAMSTVLLPISIALVPSHKLNIYIPSHTLFIIDPQMSEKNLTQLIDKTTRNRIFSCRYWKEECFALNAESIIDKAIKLKCIGGLYGGSKKPTKFLCLVFKMLQMNLPREICELYLAEREYKYLTAMAILFLRLTVKAPEIYSLLEPFYVDNRKLKSKNSIGILELTFIDKFVEDLLSQQVCLGLTLPFIPKRLALELQGVLEPRKSLIEEELNNNRTEGLQIKQEIREQSDEDREDH